VQSRLKERKDAQLLEVVIIIIITIIIIIIIIR